MESRKAGLWKGRLNDDGLVTEMYSYLWLAGEKHPELRRRLLMPDTILYERGFPKAWYAWEATSGDEEKTLRKYLGKDIAVDVILKKFCHNARQDVVAEYITVQRRSAGLHPSPSSCTPDEAWSEAEPSELASRETPQPLASSATDGDERWSLSVQYLTSSSLASFLAGRAHGNVGVLQRYIPVNAMHNCAFEVSWSPLSSVVTQLRSGSPTSDPLATVSARYATVDSEVSKRVQVNVQPHTKQKILQTTGLLTSCLAATEGALMSGLSVVIKVDTKGNLVLLYCTSIRSRSADIALGGRDPLFVGADYINAIASAKRIMPTHFPGPVPPKSHDCMRDFPDATSVRVVAGGGCAAPVIVGDVYLRSGVRDVAPKPLVEEHDSHRYEETFISHHAAEALERLRKMAESSKPAETGTDEVRHRSHFHRHDHQHASLPQDQHSELRRSLLLFLEDMVYLTRAHRERQPYRAAHPSEQRTCEAPYFQGDGTFHFRFPHELGRSIGSSGVQLLMRVLQLKRTTTLYDIHGHSADYYSFPWTATIATQAELYQAVLTVFPPVVLRKGKKSFSRRGMDDPSPNSLSSIRRPPAAKRLSVNHSVATVDEEDEEDDFYDDGCDVDDEVYRTVTSEPEPEAGLRGASATSASPPEPSPRAQRMSPVVPASPAANPDATAAVSKLESSTKPSRTPSPPEPRDNQDSTNKVSLDDSTTNDAVAMPQNDALHPSTSFRPTSEGPHPSDRVVPVEAAIVFTPPPPLIPQPPVLTPQSPTTQKRHPAPALVVRRATDWRLQSGFPKLSSLPVGPKKRQPLSAEQRELRCTLSPQRKRIYFPEGKRDKPGPSVRHWMGGRRDGAQENSEPAPLSDAAMQYLQKRNNAQQSQQGDSLMTKMPFLSPDVAPKERKPEDIMREFWTQ